MSSLPLCEEQNIASAEANHMCTFGGQSGRAAPERKQNTQRAQRTQRNPTSASSVLKLPDPLTDPE